MLTHCGCSEDPAQPTVKVRQPCFPVRSLLLWQALFLDQLLNALFDLLADHAHPLKGLAFGVLHRPVVRPQSGHVRTLLAWLADAGEEIFKCTVTHCKGWQAAPQPMVTSSAAPSATSFVSLRGTALVRSMPTSFMALSTSGCTDAEGLVPADTACALPGATRWLKKAAAIWLRPALATHANT